MNFIVIDDSKLDCFIAEKIIKSTGICKVVKSFFQAPEALKYIAAQPNDEKTVVFIDIQMPVMNGFEFVEEFEKMSAEIKKNYNLYIISSSINENDLNRVNSFPSVKQFINKPLTSAGLISLLETLPQ
jgi:two-component SAPR family response regulator